MRREIVERNHWIEENEFFQMFAACNLMPGPSSTELAVYLGYRLAGPLGLVLAGSLFIAPAMLIMLGIAVAYIHYGTTHIAVSGLNGIRPVVVAIVTWALFDLGKRFLTRWVLWPIAIAVFGLSLAAVPPIRLLALAGITDQVRNHALLGIGKAALPFAVITAHPGRGLRRCSSPGSCWFPFCTVLCDSWRRM